MTRPTQASPRRKQLFTLMPALHCRSAKMMARFVLYIAIFNFI